MKDHLMGWQGLLPRNERGEDWPAEARRLPVLADDSDFVTHNYYTPTPALKIGVWYKWECPFALCCPLPKGAFEIEIQLRNGWMVRWIGHCNNIWSHADDGDIVAFRLISIRQ